MKVVKVTGKCGALITDIILDGIKMAKSMNCIVYFEDGLNGVYVTLDPDSELEIVMRDHERSQNGLIGETIGPHYEKELSAETIAREKEYQERKAEACRMEFEAERQISEAKEMQAEALLDFIQIEEMTFLDKESEADFRKLAAANADEYGSIIVKMANDLARLLEFKLGVDGKITASLVKRCEQIVFGDLHSASGFQANTAENIISQYWFRGAEFFPFTYRGKRERNEI